MRLAALAVLIACGGDHTTTVPADAPPGVVAVLTAFTTEASQNGSDVTVWGADAAETPAMTTSRDDGPCHIEDTTTTGTSVLADVGTISFTTTSGEVLLQPDDEERYSNFAQGLTYQAGDAITVSATGSDVPAFTSSIVFPGAVE